MRQALRESEAVGSFLRYLSPVPQNLVSIFEEDGEKRKYVTSQELDLHCFCFLEAMQVKIIYSYCHISAYLEISRYTLSELRKTSVQNYKNLLWSLSYSTNSEWVVLKGGRVSSWATCILKQNIVGFSLQVFVPPKISIPRSVYTRYSVNMCSMTKFLTIKK